MCQSVTLLFFLLLKKNEICLNLVLSALYEHFINSSQDPVSLLKAPKLLIINKIFDYLHRIISLPLIPRESNEIVQMMKSPDSQCPIFTIYSSNTS